MKFIIGDKVKVKQSDDLVRFKNITFTVIENNNNYIHSVIVQDKYGTMANFKPDELELINEQIHRTI